MKLLAQDGHQQSDKIFKGLERDVINGAVLSARYLDPEKARKKTAELRLASKQAMVLLDPEYYATRQIGTPNNQLGYLEEWSYFGTQRRRDLVRGTGVEVVLEAVGKAVANIDVSAHIAPNVYIAQSFDSLEAGIALNFVAGSKGALERLRKPVYATLAIDRRALLSPSDFKAFLNDVTALESPPDGFYILVGGGLIDERSDLAHSEVVDAKVIGGWMMLNFTLTQNGFKVINGCSDLLAPFLCAAGGTAGATGWWSNLRLFTMGRYIKPEGRGGALPIVRYVSNRLMNRLKFDELAAYSRVLPEVLNGLPCDNEYVNGIPNRTTEALQTWEAISSLNQELTQGDLDSNLKRLAEQIEQAQSDYRALQARGISEGIETVTEYLQQLSGSIETFKSLAEL